MIVSSLTLMFSGADVDRLEEKDGTMKIIIERMTGEDSDNLLVRDERGSLMGTVFIELFWDKEERKYVLVPSPGQKKELHILEIKP